MSAANKTYFSNVCNLELFQSTVQLILNRDIHCHWSRSGAAITTSFANDSGLNEHSIICYVKKWLQKLNPNRDRALSFVFVIFIPI